MINKETIFDYTFYINSCNGIYHTDKSFFDYQYFYTDYDLIDRTFKDYKSDLAVFCVNLSSNCNLRCDYCFNENKKETSLDVKDIISFLDMCFETYKDKNRYKIDLSGKGEPLLYLNKILQISAYCKAKSNEIRKEILVCFVCNGTLLSEPIVNILQKEEILFGVSIDGNKFIHDLHRKTINGKDTYNTIIDNVKNIKHNEFLGCATTLTKDVFDLVDSIKQLSKYFTTLSYKPARNCNESFDEESLSKWLCEYDKLVSFLLEKSINNDLDYVKVLLNGEDYLGKFLLRILLNHRTIIRCNAGLSRVTLDDDKKVYICPSASNIEKYCIGDISSLNYDKQSQIYDLQKDRSSCMNCSIKYICGGECLIEKHLSNGNNHLMCKYKKHLVLLSIYFKERLSKENYNAYSALIAFANEVSQRNKINVKFKEFLNENKTLSFLEAKHKFEQYY